MPMSAYGVYLIACEMIRAETDVNVFNALANIVDYAVIAVTDQFPNLNDIPMSDADVRAALRVYFDRALGQTVSL
mgnify:CR=1 FL=1